jgi:signal transduction histidine kinase/CheY-like chemotaxis protein
MTDHTPIDISLFALLRQEFGASLPIVRCTKATLVHLSHTLEDIVLSERIPALIFTGFQESSHWREETARYRALAEVAQQVCIFAGGTLPPESDARQLHVTLQGDDPLRQEWFLAVFSEKFSALLCGQDQAVPVAEEATRQFDTIWSFDPAVIDRVLDLLEQVVAHYRPERLQTLRAARQSFPARAPDAALMTHFTSELLRFEERLHAQLRYAKEEAEQANRAKSEFLASVSHELRTPLNAILGLSEALQEQVYGDLNPKQQTSLHTIEESGRHLLSLINEILDLSKLGAGKLDVDLSPTMIEPLCQSSLRLIRQSAQKKRLTVSYTFDSNVSVVNVDERRLKQILVNLLSNAVKFTPEGNAIGLEVIGDLEQQEVRFVVWDQGIGIAPQDTARIFQPFVQVDSSLARQYSGTGLGLALVHRLVDLHGGSVSVESEQGHGSRFIVRLPWSPLDHQRGTSAATPTLDEQPIITQPQSNRPAHQYILMAEDNEDNITTVADYLRVKGYRVEVANTGAQAVAQAYAHTPMLILMDVQMPEMDGLEATRRIRQAPSLATVPIIALTSSAMPGDRERCIAAGATDYLSKPVRLRELTHMIEQYIGHNGR